MDVLGEPEILRGSEIVHRSETEVVVAISSHFASLSLSSSSFCFGSGSSRDEREKNVFIYRSGGK